jgi:hypothetical protein
MQDDRRRQRKEIDIQQSESVWLQKALFALRKAEAAHEKLADARDEEPDPYTLQVEDGRLAVDSLQEALEERIKVLLATIRERRRAMR